MLPSRVRPTFSASISSRLLRRSTLGITRAIRAEVRELAVLTTEPELRAARLVLARAVRVVLRNGLRILNVSAPVRMERALEEPEASPAN